MEAHEDTKLERWWRSALTSLWGAWLVVTFITFLLLMFAGGRGARWSHLPYAIFNLFTPVLLGNLSQRCLEVFALLGFTLLVGGLLGRSIQWPLLRIVYNLSVLFTLTVACDFLVWGHWMSWAILHRALGEYGWVK